MDLIYTVYERVRNLVSTFIILFGTDGRLNWSIPRSLNRTLSFVRSYELAIFSIVNSQSYVPVSRHHQGHHVYRLLKLT